MSDSDFLTLHEIVRKARQNLDQNAWDYIVGGTETETTLRRNRMALDEIAFRPRVLRDVSHVDASTEVLGRKLRIPVMLAPVGALETFHAGAAATVVRGAGAFGAAHMLSSVCEPGLEAVAKAAPDALRIFQLYVRGDDAYVEDHVNRAAANGYAAFCLTVDTAHYSRRERDLAKRYVTAGRQRVSGQTFQMALDWRTVKLIKDKSPIPLILKGIATAEDAKIAVDHGVEWIYVSNHGGRQLDHGRGAMQALPEIIGAVAGRAKIMVDGSFCRGTDIVKGIAAGADLIVLAACSAGPSPPPAKPASCGCSNCWKTKCAVAWGYSALNGICRSRQVLSVPNHGSQCAACLDRSRCWILRLADIGRIQRPHIAGMTTTKTMAF